MSLITLLQILAGIILGGIIGSVYGKYHVYRKMIENNLLGENSEDEDPLRARKEKKNGIITGVSVILAGMFIMDPQGIVVKLNIVRGYDGTIAAGICGIMLVVFGMLMIKKMLTKRIK